MKNKIILSLVAIIFISSCANKFSLTKRKYTKGYYFASSKSTNNSKKETDNITVKKLTQVKTTLPAGEVATTEIVKAEPISFFNPEILAEKKQASAQKPTDQKITASANEKTTVPAKPLVKAVPEKQNLNTASKKADADTNLIIMVILCFLWFFNLIAIYLHDGKKVTINFIITLLLDFTFVLGIVYALLVVLDIVDLSK